jgi:Uma2 family endonuclease
VATATVKISPVDHGRRMSLADFEFAEVQEGYIYELGRGIIVVSDVPNPRHLRQLTAIRRQLAAYDLTNPGRIYTVAGGSDCKLLAFGYESERHPDLSVYKTAPPHEDSTVWRTWIPEIVVEIISPDSGPRDYDEKREEYLAIGVRDYWIIDADRQEILALRRHGDRWRETIVRPGQTYRTRTLPGFELIADPIFAAATGV